MQTALFAVTLKRSIDPINLYFLTDFHIGHINHDSEKLESVKKIIQNDPYAKVIIGGDNVDGRMPDHKFFDLGNLDPKIKTSKFINNCYKAFEDFVSDISEKVLAMHCGNHETKINSVAPYVENICERRQCAFLGYRALSILKVDCSSKGAIRSYKIFSTHGSGGGRKSGAKVNRIEDEALSNNCDIFLQGHTHYLSCTYGIVHDVFCMNNKVAIRERQQIFVNGGSFLKSYQVGNYNYSEKASYKPQQTGCVMLEIRPYENKIKGHILT